MRRAETTAPSGGRKKDGFGVWVLMIDELPIHLKSFAGHYVRPNGVSGIRTRAELKKGCADRGVHILTATHRSGCAFLPATQTSSLDPTF